MGISGNGMDVIIKERNFKRIGIDEQDEKYGAEAKQAIFSDFDHWSPGSLHGKDKTFI